MWQSYIFGMHWRHQGTMYYDELTAESVDEAADYFIDHKRDDVALVRVELVRPDEPRVRAYALSTRCERAADWTRMRMPGDQPAGRSRVRWFVALVAATIIAAIPTRITSHDFALGIPFTWRTRQTLVASADELRELHSLN